METELRLKALEIAEKYDPGSTFNLLAHAEWIYNFLTKGERPQLEKVET